MRWLLAVAVVASAGALLPPAAASAHPLGNFTVNRYSRLEVGPERTTLRYVLDLAEIPTLQELTFAGISASPDAAQRAALLGRFASQLRDGARLVVDGARVGWTDEEGSLEVLPGQAGLSTLRVTLTLAAPVRLAGRASLDYRDANFPDRIGWREVVLRAAPGVRLEGATVPAEDQTDELRTYPSDPTRPPLDVTTASATAHLAAGTVPSIARAPNAGASRFGVDAVSNGVAGLLRAGSGGDVLATLLALLAAAGIGALHAATPGHGKTLMAAYLVGTRGTPRQALALGGVVAASHTAGVLVLALAILSASGALAPERFYPYLSALSALIMLGIGIWLVAHLRREHTHARAHANGHEHGHSHAHDTGGPARVGWRALAALGVSGGVIPSASAVLLLLAGVSLRRPDLGVLLIVAFGIGMATVLVGIGLAMVGARGLAARHLSDRPLFRQLGRTLPAATAVIVLLVGVGLSLQAGQQLLEVL